MVTERYRRYLKSEAWRLKRRRALAHYGHKCYACGTHRGTIQIHHLTYVRLGHELMRDLRPLCVSCHRAVTNLHWKMGKRKVSGEVVFAAYMKMTKEQRTALLIKRK